MLIEWDEQHAITVPPLLRHRACQSCVGSSRATQPTTILQQSTHNTHLHLPNIATSPPTHLHISLSTRATMFINPSSATTTNSPRFTSQHVVMAMVLRIFPLQPVNRFITVCMMAVRTICAPTHLRLSFQLLRKTSLPRSFVSDASCTPWSILLQRMIHQLRNETGRVFTIRN
jgi:hypothetical protein